MQNEKFTIPTRRESIVTYLRELADWIEKGEVGCRAFRSELRTETSIPFYKDTDKEQQVTVLLTDIQIEVATSEIQKQIFEWSR